MKIFLAALVFLGFAIFIMCFNLIFRKNKPFPDSEIEHNKELRKRGILCAREEEMKIWGKKRKGGSSSCSGSCGDCGAIDCNIFNKKE